MADVKGFLSELRRRKVIHTVVVYAALACAAIEVATTLLRPDEASHQLVT